jgi:hypothetical protein
LRSIEFNDPTSITRFDRLDFVFLDGDATLPPWAPSQHKLCLLVKMCMMTGKCLFGANFAASLLASMCSTGGEIIHAINGHGHGIPLRGIPISISPPTTLPEVTSLATQVLLDSETGDCFVYNHVEQIWEPKCKNEK